MKVQTVVFFIAFLLAYETAAEAPPGRYTIAGGIVTDTRTGLEWQQAWAPSAMTWSGASSYCQNLSLGGTGWRLPDIKELQTIVDETRYRPAIDIISFPGTPSSSFWSSSSMMNIGTHLAWVVHFYNGQASTNGTANDQLKNVRCVR